MADSKRRFFWGKSGHGGNDSRRPLMRGSADRQRPCRWRHVAPSVGFTLFETLLALLVFAVVATTVFQHTEAAIFTSAGLEERVFSAWIAENKIAQIGLEQETAQQVFDIARGGELEYAGRLWQVDATLTDTELAAIKRITLSVCPVGRRCQESMVGFLYVGAKAL